MTVQCCKCKKVRFNDDWMVPLAPPQGIVSHSYCPICAEETRIEFFSVTASGVTALGAAHAAHLITKRRARAKIR
jgi:hypothetical protein